MSDLREIELIPAHEWQCEDCGRRNFASGVTFEPTPEDIEDDPSLLEGQWMMAPAVVVCSFCGSKFSVRDMREMDL